MNVLIVEEKRPLAELWKSHLERQQATVHIATTQADALAALEVGSFNMIILDVLLEERGTLSLSDIAQYRQPQAKVIFITATSFFSDGSLFQLCPNACAFLPRDTAPEDLTAVAQHYAA